MASDYSLLGIIKATAMRRDIHFVLGRLFELIFGYPLYLLSFFTPRQKNKWLFGTNVGFTDNAKYLFIYTHEQKDEIRPIWITNSKKDVNHIRAIGMEAYRKYSFKGLFHCLTASVYVFTYHSKDINFFTSGNVRKVNLWHGVGIKNMNPNAPVDDESIVRPKVGFWKKILLPHKNEKNTLFLSTSPMMDKHFRRMFYLDQRIIVNAAYPRNYFMCKPKEEIETFIEKYESIELKKLIDRIAGFRKSFLYMPTWRRNLNDDFIKEAGFDFEKLNHILEKHQALFFFKLHPAVKIIQNESKPYSNIVFLDKDIDIYPLLPFVSTLITDYSSIYYDYLLLDKNIILYPFDIESYNLKDSFSFDYDIYAPGCRAHTIEELFSLIESDSDFRVLERRRIMESFWGTIDMHSLSPLYSKIKEIS